MSHILGTKKQENPSRSNSKGVFEVPGGIEPP